MILKAGNDIYGKVETLTSKELRHILDLIDGYMKDIPYEINEIRKDSVYDKHGRIDIEIRYVDKNNLAIVQQKLLILDDELIDGKTFHKRFSEWY